MRITVLAVPGCPNTPLAVERVAEALAGRPARVELVEVHDQEQATRLGMNGSPTILMNGADPFATDGSVPSLSCRLYRDTDGTVSGAPSLAALTQVIEGGLGRPEARDSG
jgi:predicted DsbA family dithiol-disulfide isomerase